ncbi:DUF2470 domain-containing protein [Protaetiibacter intestinalis]|uniref:DUF2470 domain-containing protein n=1 Tax=Protaetiibacter intestinalis TaxID=2419774 RepID=A0A387B6D6_9MICO|nr:DUF2470 domain-containing protein [Protaetiibacter intestinalis]AYF97913.1 DUF2470 domain-containing protein [Protaetiibacter intestinalis]
MTVFSPEVVGAVLAHMNGDHTDDNTLIVRAFGEVEPDDAEMIGLDHLGGVWRYRVDGAEHELRVPWSREISERPEIRREVVVLYNAACERLGVTPRPHA